MRLHIGNIPEDESFDPCADVWTSLREPKSVWIAQLLSLPMAVLAVIGVGALWWFINPTLHIHITIPINMQMLLGLWIGMAVLIIVHEGLHLIIHPHFGLTHASILGMWPSRFLFYAHYDGEISKARFVLILAAPFVVLSILPIFICFPLGIRPVWLVAMSLFNALCACMDLLGIVMILWQIPNKAILRNKGYKTFWRIENSHHDGDTYDNSQTHENS